MSLNLNLATQHHDLAIVNTSITLHVASVFQQVSKKTRARATSGIIVETYTSINPSIKPNIENGELAYYN
jgi:hypothetical protein